jgi:hypothetical protein
MLALAEERCGRRDTAIRDYVRAYRHAPDLANPDLNPLVYDSRVQTEAALKYYREKAVASTLKVTPIDAAAVRQMMLIRAAHEGPRAAQPTSGAPAGPQAQPTPQPAAPTPGGPRLPSPRPTPTPQP